MKNLELFLAGYRIIIIKINLINFLQLSLVQVDLTTNGLMWES